MLIVGASGSGKSSLARAGVAASLTQFAADGQAQHWRTGLIIPSLTADDLCGSLVQKLAEALPELADSGTAVADIAAGIKKDAALTMQLSIAPAFARAEESAGGPVHVLVLLDQMEELWTDRRITAADRGQLFNVIEALLQNGHVAVLATLRSDYYPQAQQLPGFLKLKGDRGQYDLLPPDPAALRRLIVEPARLAGLDFERHSETGRTLDEEVLKEACRDSTVLPLLEYALSELYRRYCKRAECEGQDKEPRRLAFADYEEMGRVEGALAQRVEDVFRSLPGVAQATLEEILPLLVTVDVEGEQVAVRRRALLSELAATAARQSLATGLISARFLTTDREDDRPVASLAHEALLRRWDRIASWISANREHLRLRAHVEHTQAHWDQQHRHKDLLLPPGLLLEEGRQLLQDAPHLLAAPTAGYIRASIAYDEHRIAQFAGAGV